MDRRTLRDLLDKEGIDRLAYDLDGRAEDDTYVLESSEGGWAVFFSERGLRTTETRFDTEDEACGHLFALLLRDRTTRRR